MAKRHFLDWAEPPASAPAVVLEDIKHFDARGMKFVWGTGVSFPVVRGSFTIKMACWKNKQDEILIRMSTNARGSDTRSFRMTGVSKPKLARAEHWPVRWIPSVVRREFEEWVADELDYPSHLD